jgi:N-methylhydantoinase A
MSAIDVAYGIHRIGNATMMRALSSVSSERGLDPSSFSLLAMGGNGGVHAGDLRKRSISRASSSRPRRPVQRAGPARGRR